MEDLYKNFISISYSPSLNDEIIKTFYYFDEFNFNEYDGLSFLLMREGTVEREYLQNSFIYLINSYCDYILRLHGIKLTPDANLAQRNQILESLIQLKDTSSPELFINIVNSNTNSLEIFSNLVELTTTMSSSEAYSILEDVSDLLINKLKISFNNILDNMDNIPDPNKVNGIIKTLLHYKKFLNISTTLIGVKLAESGFLLNKPYKYYIPFIKSYLEEEKNISLFVKQVYSILLMVDQENQTGYQLFKNIINDLNVINNLNTFYEIDKEFNQLHEQFNGYIHSLHSMNQL